MGQPNDYVLTRRVWSLLRNLSGREKLVCFRCGGEIVPGMKIHKSHNNVRERWFKIYHSECYEDMFIEL